MENELTTGSILALFETTKDQRTSFVADVIQRIDEGEIDPLKIHLQVKGMEDIINSLTVTDEKKNKNFSFAQKYKSALLEAAEKNGKKFTLYSAEFSIKEVGTKYDYSQCNDAVLVDLYAKQTEITEAVKNREKMLQTLAPSGLVVTDTDSGETNTIYPPSKSSTTSVAVSLK